MQKRQKNKSSVASMIVAGLTEFRDVLCDGRPLQQSERFTVRTVELDLDPTQYAPETVRATRAMLSVSQPVFAQLLGTSVDTIQSWEQGVRVPSRMARRFMDEIRANPDHWMRRLRQAMVNKASA